MLKAIKISHPYLMTKHLSRTKLKKKEKIINSRWTQIGDKIHSLLRNLNFLWQQRTQWLILKELKLKSKRKKLKNKTSLP